MRLISQDSMFDVPYEGYWLRLESIPGREGVLGLNVWSGYDFCCRLGTYSSKERGLAVMKEIRELSADPDVVYYQLPKDEDF